MGSPNEILQKLEKIDVNLSAQIAMELTASVAVKAQKKQLFTGLRSDDTPIVPPYTPGTVARKKKKKQPFNRVTLKDKENFYKGVLMDVRGEDYIMTSADSKTVDLEKKYSKKILGLGSDAKQTWKKQLEPAFIKEIKSYLK